MPACRFCGAALTRTFLDLGKTPLANSYVTAEQVAAGRYLPPPPALAEFAFNALNTSTCGVSTTARAVRTLFATLKSSCVTRGM